MKRAMLLLLTMGLCASALADSFIFENKLKEQVKIVYQICEPGIWGNHFGMNCGTAVSLIIPAKSSAQVNADKQREVMVANATTGVYLQQYAWGECGINGPQGVVTFSQIMSTNDIDCMAGHY